MKKFKFNLQKVLDVANAEEKLALERFAKAQSKVLAEKKVLARLNNEFYDLKNSYPATFVDSTSLIYDLKNKENYAIILQKQIEFSKLKLKELEKELRQMRVVLIEKIKKRKLLDNLKGKAWIRYMEEFEREEQLFLDEIGVTRFARNEEECL